MTGMPKGSWRCNPAWSGEYQITRGLREGPTGTTSYTGAQGRQIFDAIAFRTEAAVVDLMLAAGTYFFFRTSETAAKSKRSPTETVLAEPMIRQRVFEQLSRGNADPDRVARKKGFAKGRSRSRSLTRPAQLLSIGRLTSARGKVGLLNCSHLTGVLPMQETGSVVVRRSPIMTLFARLFWQCRLKRLCRARPIGGRGA